jgi:hypothetical protein
MNPIFSYFSAINQLTWAKETSNELEINREYNLYIRKAKPLYVGNNDHIYMRLMLNVINQIIVNCYDRIHIIFREDIGYSSKVLNLPYSYLFISDRGDGRELFIPPIISIMPNINPYKTFDMYELTEEDIGAIHNLFPFLKINKDQSALTLAPQVARRYDIIKSKSIRLMRDLRWLEQMLSRYEILEKANKLIPIFNQGIPIISNEIHIYRTGQIAIIPFRHFHRKKEKHINITKFLVPSKAQIECKQKVDDIKQILIEDN